MSQGGREGERCGSSATPRSRATRRSSESGPSGRCETLAAAARLAHRALGRGTRLRVFGICRRGARHRSLWTGLRGAGHRRHRGGHRPRGQLPRTQPQTWFLAPGVPRRAGVRCPFLFDRRLRARPFRRHPAAGILGGVGWFVAVPQPTAIPISPLVISLPNFSSFKGDLESPALPLVQLTGDPTGATTSVDLHFRGRLGDAPVMYVRTGAPAYWRGLVFDQYRDGVWTATNHDYREMQPFVPPRFLPPAPPHNLGTFVQTFRVLRPLPGVINAAYPIESLYAPVAALREDLYGAFHTPDQLRPGQTYSVVSYLPDLSADALRGGELERVARQNNPAYHDPGGLSARERQMAVEATKGASNEFDAVMALTGYLQRGYQYTLDLPRVPAGRDPVDWFLFDVKTGYCEQFA